MAENIVYSGVAVLKRIKLRSQRLPHIPEFSSAKPIFWNSAIIMVAVGLRARKNSNINRACAAVAGIRMCHLERATLFSHGAAMGYSVPAPSGAQTNSS